jgi:putative transposase
MARLTRLSLPGHAHLVVQRGQGHMPVFADAHDRSAYVAALFEAAAATQVQLHAYALLDQETRLLVTTPAQPAQALPAAPAVTRLMQALGRRYVAGYNRRHGRAGSVWAGRFGAAVLQSGPWVLDALLWVDGASSEPGHTSAAHRTGSQPLAPLANPPELWALGNTPFEREAAYSRLLQAGVSTDRAAQLRQAALGGWALGSAAFVAGVAQATARPSRPRPRGRPPLRRASVKPAG